MFVVCAKFALKTIQFNKFGLNRTATQKPSRATAVFGCCCFFVCANLRTTGALLHSVHCCNRWLVQCSLAHKSLTSTVSEFLQICFAAVRSKNATQLNGQLTQDLASFRLAGLFRALTHTQWLR